MRAALLCEAVEIVTNGKDSTSSNIGKITFDKTFADVLPIQLAFFVSTSNKKEVLANDQGKSWSSFDKIEGVKKIDDYSAEYRIDDATQTISILARGDFNGDKMEDILLFVKNSITGASHSPTRLFVLTRYQGESMFRFVKEYKLRSLSG